VQEESLFDFLIKLADGNAQNPDAQQTSVVFDAKLGDETSRGVVFDHVGDILNAFAKGINCWT